MRYVYDFDEQAPGGRELLGGKGVGLAEMTALGVPVPAGFTITTDACRAYMAAGKQVPDGLDDEVGAHIAALEERAGKRFGDPSDPLLVSVRSGAAISMPGMMDTILNLGLNDVAVEGLAASTGNPRFAYDSYRRLIQMYGEVVDGVDGQRFEGALADLKAAARRRERRRPRRRRPARADRDVPARSTRRRSARASRRTRASSCAAPIARSSTPGTRRGRRSTGARTRSRTTSARPSTSSRWCSATRARARARASASRATRRRARPVLYGEFLVNAQGEDVVAGIRTPEPIAAMQRAAAGGVRAADRRRSSGSRRTTATCRTSSSRSRRARSSCCRRAPASAPPRRRCAIAVEMAGEGLISREEAVARIDPGQLDQLLHPMIDPAAQVEVAAQGLNASPGAASGEIVLDADTAEARGKAGDDVILVRWETTPDDIHGLIQARGVLTAHGGMTSHAAVVARGMGKPCVAGCEGLSIDARAGTVTIGEHALDAGDVITIDGGTGRVIVGPVRLVPPAIDENFGTILGWADELRRLRVRANADTPEDAAKAREFGAEGIGLCRTEHMFMAQDRLPIVQEMILAATRRRAAPRSTSCCRCSSPTSRGSSRRWPGFPVTIRLLDPPLHEFLPSLEEATSDEMRRRIAELHEANPMLGTRGCRLGLQWPEIYEMQVRAIVRAAPRSGERTGEAPLVEIMHPLVGFARGAARACAS